MSEGEKQTKGPFLSLLERKERQPSLLMVTVGPPPDRSRSRARSRNRSLAVPGLKQVPMGEDT
jgi:hypothetical protein